MEDDSPERDRGQDKRTYKRAQAASIVEITLPDGSTFTGGIRDVSLDALHMECDRQLDLGTSLTFCIRADVSDSPVNSEIRGSAKVIRASETGMVIELLTFLGVDFNVFSDFLMHYIENTS